MTSGFEIYCHSHTNLSDEEIERIVSTAIPGSLQRNESLLQQGQVCRHKTFILKGLLRTYGIAEDGSEYILQFSTDNSWTLDAESYHLQSASQFNITAIERTEVLQWTRADFDRLLTDIPALNIYSLQLITRTTYTGRQRLFTTLSASPEEKYEDFVRTYPDLLARLPLHMIAAYLGISLKTLTRIRHSQLHR
ncbi:cAMP-binding domain of CRP or a regulatory subunit of cAMP-dependent protein kinases [Chitinophaga sp. CF118]|uniref:Crp/Fnr family transcriptional regulator n=1 Tax=Chitinophaga sp. CF118 TaxID=1884367 RepID=UPI0008EC7B42|nr:Crp/Fnr family transcriptional regulator [Chitinophaga sp. CF118]SFD60198.1 cAMP-binding domain of CRP or a regulatory subunit of cAMP-dependent protein kinases [Chitinophaga sp. CF118]